MKRIIFLMLAVMFAGGVWGQIQTVALLEPITKGGNVTNMHKQLVLAALKKSITNIGGYEAFARTDINAIEFEQAFQRSGKVDDEQKRKSGIMSGVDFICISNLTEESRDILIEITLINVETGKYFNSDNDFIEKGTNAQINEVCQNLSERLLKSKGDVSTSNRTSNSGNRSSSGSNYTETGGNVNIEMIYVKGGTFTMGCTSEQGSCDNDESPAHQVTVSDFYIGKYEVTQAQWQAVMGTSIRTQSDKANTSWSIYGEGSNYPMYYVSWEEAMDFCRELSRMTGKQYRLLTEAEWEYAARGGSKGTGAKYSGGSSPDRVAWYDGNSGGSTHSVGTKAANELGIYDMSGNVWEWCSDWYGDYSSGSQTNPQGANSGSRRVLRGGSWRSNASFCRVANRNNAAPVLRSDYIGFRLACSSK
jgi:formylglycine-generating enzyme required for sulfatase activity